MAKIIQRRHLNKDDPIYTGHLILTSYPKIKPQKELDTSEQENKEQDQ